MIKELSSECSSGICFMSTRQMRNAAVRMYPIGVNEGKKWNFSGPRCTMEGPRTATCMLDSCSRFQRGNSFPVKAF